MNNYRKAAQYEMTKICPQCAHYEDELCSLAGELVGKLTTCDEWAHKDVIVNFWCYNCEFDIRHHATMEWASENKFNYCPQCGRKIEKKPFGRDSRA